ncbi:MAG: amino acid adenylation domain-containing protein [Pyrinomonadaceae bacterium]
MTQEILEGFRLSPQQRRLWLWQRGGHAYHAACAVRLEGRLDTPALREAVARLVARHEILRTTFDWLPGMKLPVQVVGEAVAHGWRELDHGGEEPARRRADITRLLEEECAAGFDFGRGPLLRCTLVRHTPTEHDLLVVVPSLCADALSLVNLVGEVARVYGALAAGAESTETDDEAVQYVQFSEWQTELLAGGGDEAGLDFWREHAKAAVPPPSLAFEARRAEEPSFEPARVSLAVDEETGRGLDALAARHGVAVGTVLLACWQTLLWRLAGVPAVVAVNVRCDGRVYEEMGQALGLYERWPPVRCGFAPGLGFAEVLRQVGTSVAEAQGWQEYFTAEGYEELRRAAGRESGGLPIGFCFDERRAEVSAGGVRFSVAALHARTEPFKLLLDCARIGDGSLALDFYYHPELYTAGEVGQLADELAALLRGVPADETTPVARLDILSEAERRRHLFEWNETSAPFPQDRCVHELFEEQAAAKPDAEAVVFAGERLSYAELNARANQLAHRLRRLGVGPDAPVVLVMERSIEMVVALLGALKAGGAYVAIDPLQPKTRLDFMLEDTAARVVLTQTALLGSLPEQHGEIICLDAEREALDAERADNPSPAASPHNLAYVIYTSGSTGRPKGVMIEHRSVVNLAFALRRAVYDGERAALRVSVNAPLSFDSSVKQIIQLLFGHALHVVPEAVRRDGPGLREYVERHGLDVLDCTPSQMRLLLDAGFPGAAGREGARTRALIGGEAIDESLWSHLAAVGAAVDSYNVYGPTECTVDATVCRVADTAGRPSLGRPVSNARLYVLDAHGNPAPAGTPGELYVGGRGVARGYLRRPGLTAEKFVPDSFSGELGARLYRTGDLVRHLPDGQVEFIGRTDDQVKVRGSRVELGEVEAVLASHPSVRAAAAAVREDAPGDQRLVAYAVASGRPAPSTSELHAFMRERLPDYMLPSAFVMLDALPLTANGKVDRKALPAPDNLRPELGGEFVAPRTPAEGLLAGIWAEVLGVEQVGVEDNFFELGGHSLLATRVVSRMRQDFKVEIQLRSIFETPTVAGLAACVEGALREQTGTAPPPFERAPRDGRLPLSFSQLRLWLLDRLEPGSTVYNNPYALRLKGALDAAALRRSLDEIVRRHEVLRTSFATVDGEPVQVIEPALGLDLPLLDLSGLEEDERDTSVRRVFNEQAGTPFDLRRAPLLRAALLRLGDEEHVLVLVVHHIIFDVWSIDVLMQEVRALYAAFTEGRPSPLAELPMQYADFAAWQRGWLQGEVLQAQTDYWKKKLGGMPPLELQTDRPRPRQRTYTGGQLTFSLPPNLTSALYDLSRRENATLYMTLLAAFQTLLHRHTGQTDFGVGTPLANRNRSEVEGLIGFFLNTIVMRCDLSGDPTFRELLARVRETSLGAYAHQELPFEKLVEELQPERSLNRNPLFQVMFILRTTSDSSLTLPGVTIEPLDLDPGIARFDLETFVNESESGLGVLFKYNTDLFDDATVTRMWGHFSNILEGVVAAPEQKISALPLLTEDERRMLAEWNQTARDYPAGQTMTRLFEEQVRRTPEAAAVRFAGERLTYRELNERANRLAHHLRSLGIGAESLVAICMERSVEMLVALLGVLKAGGAYVPLDPEYPQQRLDFIIEETQAPLLLTQEHLRERIAPAQARVVALDAEAEAIARRPAADLAPLAHANNLAYVIYTSGSTGRPKGVAIEHRSAAAFIDWVGGVFAPEQLAGVLASTSICFDLSVFEIFGTLCHGGAVVLAKDALQLPSLAAAGEVTLINTVPSAMAELVRAEAVPPSVTTINLAGEPLQNALAQQAYGRGNVERVFNLYGPSEDTTYSTFSLVQKGSERQPTIGRPVANTQLYILDQRLQPVPVGIPGELYLGGAGLARGYLKRPGLSAERFIPNPFSREPGARLYRTGDRARLLSNGDVEFMGRNDDQVKVRGFRIELGEVEAVLAAHAGVRQCAAAVLGEGVSDKWLVAYVVPARDNALTSSELRGFMRERLPEYMVPSAFVLIDALPLTENGKVNRRALPEPGQERLAPGNTFVAPRTALERVIADIWAEVLGLERVGVEDNFFDLGGHSLLATQVTTRLSEIFQVELPVRNTFETPTVAGLAQSMERDREHAWQYEQIAQALGELEGLSDEETEAMLERERQTAGGGGE